MNIRTQHIKKRNVIAIASGASGCMAIVRTTTGLEVLLPSKVGVYSTHSIPPEDEVMVPSPTTPSGAFVQVPL